ncbi:MAG: histidine kinase [Bacillota bacterium]
MQNFFEVNTDLLCIIDLNGNFIKVNKAWEKLLGYSIEDIEKMNIFDFIHPEDIDDTNKIIEKLKRDKNINKFVNRYKDKNDNYHYIEWSSNNRLQGDYFYASARDITKEKNQENKLKYQNELQDIIRNISLNLLELDSSNVDEIIDKNLERLKVFLKKNSYYILKKEKGLLEFINIFIKLMNSVQKIVKENIESNNKLKNLNIRLKREIEIKNTYHMAFLKSQIKPHFLFNTLSTIINLSNKKPDKSFELIEKLADFLKYNYEISPSKDYSTLKKELDQVNLYMDIQKERFQDRISFQVFYDDNILDYKIPYLMIQPLIENALFHGILKKIDGGEILLEIIEKNDKLDIIVMDTGFGFDENTKISEEDSTGVGLANINRRLNYLFNEKLEINSTKDKTVIKFSIPKISKLPENERIYYD